MQLQRPPQEVIEQQYEQALLGLKEAISLVNEYKESGRFEFCIFPWRVQTTILSYLYADILLLKEYPKRKKFFIEQSQLIFLAPSYKELFPLGNGCAYFPIRLNADPVLFLIDPLNQDKAYRFSKIADGIVRHKINLQQRPALTVKAFRDKWNTFLDAFLVQPNSNRRVFEGFNGVTIGTLQLNLRSYKAIPKTPVEQPPESTEEPFVGVSTVALDEKPLFSPRKQKEPKQRRITPAPSINLESPTGLVEIAPPKTEEEPQGSLAAIASRLATMASQAAEQVLGPPSTAPTPPSQPAPTHRPRTPRKTRPAPSQADDMYGEYGVLQLTPSYVVNINLMKRIRAKNLKRKAESDLEEEIFIARSHRNPYKQTILNSYKSHK